MDLSDPLLEYDMVVKFKPSPKQRWQFARVRGIEADGSIRLSDRDGRTRARQSNQIQIQSPPGPRGGQGKWVLLDDARQNPDT